MQVGVLHVPNCNSPPAIYFCTSAYVPGSRCVLVNDGGNKRKAIKEAGLQPCQTCTHRLPETGKPLVQISQAKAKPIAIAQPPKSPFTHSPNQFQFDTLRDVFQEVVCVNLDRRPDRWESFLREVPADWPLAPITRVPAIDGRLMRTPDWFTGGRAAWGCFRSHFRIIEDAINRNLESILILEDDAIFIPEFTDKLKVFLSSVPDNWGMLYLGGQHLRPPTHLNERVVFPFNVNRTHAYALRGQSMLHTVYRHLLRTDWLRSHHIDHHYGRLHSEQANPIYAPREWLVGQGDTQSDITGKFPPKRFWQPGAPTPNREQPTVFVIGLHSSGSSALAGVLWHLGLYFGNNLGGYYGSKPGEKCGYEEAELARLCEDAIPFPSTSIRIPNKMIWKRLKDWLSFRKREAPQSLLAAKYPQLCRFPNQILNLCGGNLRIIHIDRPLEESIESMVRRTKRTREEISAHQSWLWEGKQELISRVNPAHVLTVTYEDLLHKPQETVGKLIAFLSLSPTPEQCRDAILSIDPTKQHIKL